MTTTTLNPLSEILFWAFIASATILIAFLIATKVIPYLQKKFKKQKPNSMDNNMSSNGIEAGKGFSNFEKFLARCGGSTMHTFEKSKPDDQQKRITMGAVVLIIASVSAILAAVAWSIPMGYPGYFVGIPWFLIMLFLERSILQQMDVVAAHNLMEEWMKGNFKAKTKSGAGVGWLLIRFIMITFICYFNSEMIRVVMFRPEIVAEIKLRQDAELSGIADNIEAAKQEVYKAVAAKEIAMQDAQNSLAVLIADYNDRIAETEDSLNFWNSKVIYEVDGPGGISGNRGRGPVTERIEKSIADFSAQKAEQIVQRDSARHGSVQANALRFAEQDLTDAKASADQQIALLDKQHDRLIERVMSRPSNGLAFMIEVLNDIAGRTPIIWAVFFMFFFIEGIPVLLKYFSKNDSFIYERALEHMKTLQDSNERAAVIYAALQQYEVQERQREAVHQE